MIFEGTYIGISFGLVVGVYLACTIWWQKRFGGFLRYVVMQAIFLGLVVWITKFHTDQLSDAALQIALRHGKYQVTTIDALRPIMMAGHGSQIFVNCATFVLIATIFFLLSVLKFRDHARERAAKECSIAKPE